MVYLLPVMHGFSHKPLILQRIGSMNEEPFLNVDELAAKIRREKSWVYQQTRRTDADSIPRRKLGKYYVFLWSEVRPWIDRHYGIGLAGGLR